MSWNPLEKQLQEYANKRMRVTEALPGSTIGAQLPSLAPTELAITHSGGLTPRPLLASLSGSSGLLPDSLTPNTSGVLGVFSMTRQASGSARSPSASTSTLHGRQAGQGSLLPRAPLPISTMSEQHTPSNVLSVRSPVAGTRGFFPSSPASFSNPSTALRSPRFPNSTLSASSSSSTLMPPPLAQAYSFSSQPSAQYQSPPLSARSPLPSPPASSEPSSPAEPTEAPVLDPPPKVTGRGKASSLALPQPPVALCGSGTHKNQLLDGDILQQLMRYLNNLDEKIKFNRQVAVRLSVPFYRGKPCSKSEERHPFLSDYKIKTLSSRNCVACLYFRRGTVHRLMSEDVEDASRGSPDVPLHADATAETPGAEARTGRRSPDPQPPQSLAHAQAQTLAHAGMSRASPPSQMQPPHLSYQSSYGEQPNPAIAQLTLATGTPASAYNTLGMSARTSPNAGGLSMQPLARLSSVSTPIPAPYNWPLPSATAAALLATGGLSPRPGARFVHIQPGTSSITPIMQTARSLVLNNPALASPVSTTSAEKAKPVDGSNSTSTAAGSTGTTAI